MFKMLGVSDEVTTCECCGKTNLKRTVVLQSDAGQVHYGVDCAAKALNQSLSVVKTNSDVVATLYKWAAKGYSADVISKGIWNRYGLLNQVRDGHIIVIHNLGEYAI